MSITIYHNCNCSKSRATLEILEQAGVKPIIVDYLKTPPTVDQLQEVLRALDLQPVEIIRFGEAAARELGIAETDVRDEGEWLQLLVEHPILIQRPIVVSAGRAVIGRPPERVKQVLDPCID